VPFSLVTVRDVGEAAVTVATTHVLFAPVKETVWLPSINHAWKAFEEIRETSDLRLICGVGERPATGHKRKLT